jgi:hypothetical protein
MTDTGNIQRYFDYHTTNELLNDTHAAEILQMFNILHTYEYNDVFDSHVIITNIGRPEVLNVPISLNETSQILQHFTGNDNNNNYKIQVFDNDDNKDIHILNCLKEVYIHNKFRKYIVDNNIEHTIVPEIFRYGIIQLPDTNKIISFIESKRYIDTNSLFIEPDKINQIRIIEEVLVKYKQTLSLIKQIEAEFYMKFNFRCKKSCDVQCYEPNIEDNYCEDTITQLLNYGDTNSEEFEGLYDSWKYNVETLLLHITSTDITEIDVRTNIGVTIDVCRNIVYYNGKFVIPDFSLSGYTEKTIKPRELFDAIV